MSTEVKLLNVIFDSASSPPEKANAAEMLKRKLNTDRDAIVAKYTDDGDGGDAETYRWFWDLEKNRRHAAEVERELAKSDLLRAQVQLYTFAAVTGQLATKMREALWLAGPEIERWANS